MNENQRQACHEPTAAESCEKLKTLPEDLPLPEPAAPRKVLFMERPLHDLMIDCDAHQCREHAEKLERWARQLRYHADMLSVHTLTGQFIKDHLGN